MQPEHPDRRGGNVLRQRIRNTFLIPLSARYIKTNSVFKGGKANASATFTLSYQ